MMATTQQVALIVGASRGIGRQVAIDLSKNGYTVVVAAKTVSDASKANPWPPNPNSQQSTISTVVREIEELGGRAAAIQVDTRDFTSVTNMVNQTVSLFGRIDVLVYNSGAIWWASVANTPMKRFQLMQRVNPEGLYGTIHAALPVFERQGWQARIIVVSPPIYSRFFRGKTAYAMGKVGMSILTKGMAVDFEREGKTGMAITSIWPAAAIESAATQNPQTDRRELRKALIQKTIYSDAILAMIRAPVDQVNGQLELDEDFLRKTGVTDFSKYSLVPGSEPRRIMPAELPDLTVAEQDDEGRRMDSAKLKKGSKI
ncbi:short chain dehydrogenase [Microthyrium microscopicum]|uniref:Short chain dehydrogenase n=1 Tax=Microthyrium microscopicum TaxID=703497 RepID=A0A6A6U252_9PEZI|nr:short chain dehydrogenase [Microthyrium microscopicum]